MDSSQLDPLLLSPYTHAQGEGEGEQELRCNYQSQL